MLIRQTLRTFEKRCLRPVARLLKRAVGGTRPGLRLGLGNDRVVLLEQRVAALESLVRELTGLAYLRLADDDAATEADRTAA
ncbi:MAG: hypothetical protein K8S94_05415 [Planctomycetia bacterium]|nr:hypothetical protein [Planctomycetia bacterium]